MSVKLAAVTDSKRRRLFSSNNLVLVDLDTTLQTFAEYIAEGMVEGNIYKLAKLYQILILTMIRTNTC